jgi:hypothetical protein
MIREGRCTVEPGESKKTFDLLGKPYASIDAELRDWDVLLGFH